MGCINRHQLVNLDKGNSGIGLQFCGGLGGQRGRETCQCVAIDVMNSALALPGNLIGQEGRGPGSGLAGQQPRGWFLAQYDDITLGSLTGGVLSRTGLRRTSGCQQKAKKNPNQRALPKGCLVSQPKTCHRFFPYFSPLIVHFCLSAGYSGYPIFP